MMYAVGMNSVGTAFQTLFYEVPELWDHIIDLVSYSRIPHEDCANYFRRMDLIKDIEEFEAGIVAATSKIKRYHKELHQKMAIFRGFHVVSSDCMHLETKIKYLQNLKHNRQETLCNLLRLSPQGLCRSRGKTFLHNKPLYRVKWLMREDIFAEELNQWRAKRVHDRIKEEEEEDRKRLREAETVVETMTLLMGNL